ncbi:hypothetical protein FE782_08210 [Paenibacillus antri]|uniref:SMP-30/Gluconolactonase/LRE-like region domain-containing protein n=1 Tax=Paenibacillus antri TaxID=2582848 RepID=A0A5R9GER7_9BACL|nr:NHL repeat-containing protein [Paenibacillus antri]TLS52610.1 hypothetical protein FE782_08210 [Paenibacillus antri]
MRRYLRAAIVVLLGCAMLPISASADSPYEGYIYDSLRNTPQSINGYLYQDSIDGYDLETGPFVEPSDIFVAEDDTFYIADTGNNRIVRMDGDRNVISVVAPEEGEGKLSSPKGVYVTEEGELYVADTGNQRIARFDSYGRYVGQYSKPDSPLLETGFTFSPSKVVFDKRGYLFAVSEGAHQGLVQLRPDGSFAGFFGANHVEFSWTRLLVRYIATKEQRDQLASVRPPEFSNLFLDREGFIYTTTFGIRANQIKRLSAVGVDILNLNESRRYGDYRMPVERWSSLFEAFVDVSVDANGVITAIDQTTGKAFQYDQLGNLLFVFGGLGNQNGLFMTPSAIDSMSDGTMLVVDKTRGRIDRFRTTPFADKVHEAVKLYVEGKYEEASVPWHEVLRMNSNYDLAYKSIGKALYRAERYEEAMTYFKAAKDRAGFSEAYLEYRKIFLRKHFDVIFGGIALLYALFKAYRYRRSRRRRAGGAAAGGGWKRGGANL